MGYSRCLPRPPLVQNRCRLKKTTMSPIDMKDEVWQAKRDKITLTLKSPIETY